MIRYPINVEKGQPDAEAVDDFCAWLAGWTGVRSSSIGNEAREVALQALCTLSGALRATAIMFASTEAGLSAGSDALSGSTESRKASHGAALAETAQERTPEADERLSTTPTKEKS
jgi:hypothetical protein